MKVLVIGSGGREHALTWKIAQNEKVEKIYCAPGNGGTEEIGENVPIKVDDIQGLLDFALDREIDLTVVGPELPLVLGIVDLFQEKGLKIFGVNRECAQLEGSKDFSKNFMKKYKIPTAHYQSYTKLEEALEGLKEFTYPLVIKADGLCAGKGVIICEDEGEAVGALESILDDKIFGCEGDKVVIEEFLNGIEASLLCLVSKDKIIPMESAKDYKKIYNDDKGPNTGGVGCYSPSPLFNKDLDQKVKEILDKILLGLKEENMDFRGILFIGLMIVDNQPMVLEFNTRFGDPETEVVLPRLESDLVELMEDTIEGRLDEKNISWSKESCLTVVLTSEGYPDQYRTGYEVSGIDALDKEIILFHNGTKKSQDQLLTNGGRVLSVTSMGKDLEEARNNIYKNVEKIKFQGVYYRHDIGL